jgi:hypothetical protein
MDFLSEHTQWSGEVRGETSACTEAESALSGNTIALVQTTDVRKGTCLARGERLERHQEREDAGAQCRNHGQQHKQDQGNEDHRNLGSWRQLLECLKRLFRTHRFPFLSISGILRQTFWCRPLTGGSARSSRIAMSEQRIAVLRGERVVLVVQKSVLVVQKW